MLSQGNLSAKLLKIAGFCLLALSGCIFSGVDVKSVKLKQDSDGLNALSSEWRFTAEPVSATILDVAATADPTKTLKLLILEQCPAAAGRYPSVRQLLSGFEAVQIKEVSDALIYRRAVAAGKLDAQALVFVVLSVRSQDCDRDLILWGPQENTPVSSLQSFDQKFPGLGPLLARYFFKVAP